MRRRLALAPLLAALLATGSGLALAGCGDDRAVSDPAPETTPDPATENAYRLTVRSSKGGTEAIRASLCGTPSSKLVELPCGVSLGFARVSAPRLYTDRIRDRLFLELDRPATAIFASLAQGVGERGLERRSALVKLGGGGRRASIGYGPSTGDFPTVEDPSYLSVLVLYKDPMPVPAPAASGVPDDATVSGAAAEYLVQLATRSKLDE
ncbi:MAG: hypothetical protein Q7T55_21165 [Solirubrobacteraceae bacterium]|nr:hypothetical protein [Solirubrobacteraceae bacterium]